MPMTLAKPYEQKYLSFYFKLDPESPSGLSWRRTGRHATSMDAHGYYRVTLNKSCYKVHRIIWCLNHGDVASEMVIDHIDRNRANNSLENLRLVDHYKNTLNRTRKKRRKFYTRHQGRWLANFKMPVSMELVYVGTYDTEQEAHLAAVSRRLELYWAV